MGPMDVDHARPEDLARLRAAFAADSLAPPLGWDAVRAFEAEHGVVLPEPYRTFVAEICDGAGSGPPGYGLLPLAGLPGDWEDDGAERDLARDFPLAELWYWDGDPRPAEEIDPLVDPIFGHGSIVLGTDGCGMNWHLVVTGPQRGQIWLITGEGAMPHGASFGLTAAEAGFAGWVEHWAAGREWFELDHE